MATELDALQLNFTASTSSADKSIDKLIGTLQTLSESLNTVNTQGFNGIVDNLSSALTNLEFAVNNIDSGKLKSISNGLKSLSKSMSGFTNSSTLTQVASGISAIGDVGNIDFTNISVLASAVNKLGSASGTQAGQNLIPIALGLKSFQNINIPQLQGIQDFAQGLRSLGSSNIVNASVYLPRLGKALTEFPKNITVPVGIEQLAELGRSLSVFGRKTSVQAAQVLPSLTKGLRELFTTLATVPSVSQNVVYLTNALAQFVSNVNRVGTSSNKASKGLRFFGNTASSVSKKTFSLAAAIGKIYATYFLLFRAFGKIRDAIDISSSLKEVENVVNTTFGSMTDKVNEFAQASIKNFGMSELSAKQYASRFQAMGVAMAIPAQSIAKAQQQLNAINPVLNAKGYSDTADSIADMSINITKLTADMASFYNVAQEDVAKDLESIFTGQTRPLRTYGLDLTNATLQEWAMKNGIDANIKSMTQAEKTLLRYQYVMANTSAVQGDFSKTSLTWANQVRILGQNFQRLGAVIGSGFIAWLRPMIVQVNAAMDSIIAAVQKTVNALGKIFGWQMIVDTTGQSLIDDTEGVADAWDDATGSAKKYAKQLLGIDELNNLTTQDKSGSGADSGIGGGLSGGNIIDPGGIKFEKFQSDIVSLFQLGDRISDKLREMLDGIDWESIYEKARNFGKGFASFLNGLIQPSTFESIGRTIAGGFNIVVESLLAFAKQGRWEQWGESLGESINGFFENFKWAEAGQAINKFIHGLEKSLKTAAETIEWKDVFSSLWSFFSNMGIDTIGIIASVVTLKQVAKWAIPGIQNLTMKAALVIGVAKISFEGGKTLGSFLNPEDKEIYATFKFSDFSDYELRDYLDGLSLMIDDFKNNNALKFTAPILFGPFGNWLTFKANVELIFENMVNHGMEYFTKFTQWVSTTFFIPMGQKAMDLWNNIKFNTLIPMGNAFITVTTEIGGYFDRLWSGIQEGAKAAANGIIGLFERAVNGIIDGVNSFLDMLNDAGSFAAELAGKSWSGIELIPNITLAKFENGGFPTQGSLFVAGETYGQTEWLGNVNGRTGVVSGYEITDISRTIRETSEQELMMLRQQNQLLSGILAKEFGISQSALGQAVQSYGQEYFDRTGRQAYQY